MQILLVSILALANVRYDLYLNDDIPERTFYSTLYIFKNQQMTKNHEKLPNMQRVNTYPATIFWADFCICFIYSIALRTRFFNQSKQYEP